MRVATKNLPPSSLLHNSNFLLLWGAYAVSAMGDHLSEMAILKTQDALRADVDIAALTARMTFTFFVPFFLLAPFAGVLADRLPRRGVMIVADVVRCGLMLSFATLIALARPLGTWGPFLPLLALGTFAAMFSPARSALLPTLIRPGQLVRANGMISGLGFIATMGAAYIGGYLADRYPPTIAFRLDAATYAASALFLALLRSPPSARSGHGEGPRRPTSRELAEGFHYLRTHRRVWELIAVAMVVWFCGPLVNSVLPAVVRDRYGGNYTMISQYRALLGAGFIVGAVLMSVLGRALRSEIAMTWGLVGVSGGVLLLAASTVMPGDMGTLRVLGGVGVVIAGAFAVSTMVSFDALLQRIVADRFRGRVFGVKDLGCTAGLLAATGALGLPDSTRIDRLAGPILLFVALVTLIAGLTTLRARMARAALGTRLTLAENFNEFIARFWWRLERVGRCTLPRDGPVILTANHTCSADPLFLSAAATHRPIAFMVAREYTNIPVVKHVMRMVECIPVNRDGQDTAATKQAIRLLRAGRAVGIFIEGRIVQPGERAEPREGVAMLALKTRCPVIPAYISGVTVRKGILAGLLSRHRARVRFGPPVDLGDAAQAVDRREALRSATQRIYAAIQSLAPGPRTPSTTTILQAHQEHDS